MISTKRLFLLMLLLCLNYAAFSQTVNIRVFAPDEQPPISEFTIKQQMDVYLQFTDKRQAGNNYREEITKAYYKIMKRSFPAIDFEIINQPPKRLRPDKPHAYIHISLVDYHVLRKRAKWIARVNMNVKIFIKDGKEVRRYEQDINTMGVRPKRNGIRGAKEALRQAHAEAAKALPRYIHSCLIKQEKYTIIETAQDTQEDKAAQNKNTRVIFSSSSGQQATLPNHEHKDGLFTYPFIKQIKESNRMISHKELAKALSHEFIIKSVLLTN